MLKNKFFYIILFAILAIYVYKFFVFNHYIIKEIVIENQSNRSDADTIKNKLQFTLEKPLHLLNLRDIKENLESIDWIKRAQVNFERLQGPGVAPLVIAWLKVSEPHSLYT